MKSNRRPKVQSRTNRRPPDNLKTERLEPRRLLAADLLAREYVPDEILVQYVAQATPAQIERVRAAAGGQLKEVIRANQMQEVGAGRLELLQIDPNLGVAAALQTLGRNQSVVFAEPNYIYQSSAVSNDTYYTNGSLWGMYSDDAPAAGPTGTTNQFGIHAEKAWANNLTGSSSIVVGIIDEGFQVTHPDLDANAWINPYEIAGDGIDNDGNGYVDDINGWDFVNNDNTVYDGTADDHGTHVAGTIGGEGGNATGIVGVNWNIKMISAKFLGSSGGTTANAVRAVDYLTDLKVRHGINLVASNNSWGGGGYSQALHDAIIRHAKQNILFVAAAGNSASNNDSTASYPSNYNTTTGTSSQSAATYDGVIGVASITSTGGLSGFSSYGATSVDLGAPGSGVWSTVPANTYASYDGTSMATPHVTGAIALYASAQPGAVTGPVLRQAILGSTTATASLAGKTVTGGRLNVFAALTMGNDQTPPSISGLSVQPGSITASINWTTNEAATTELLYGTSPSNLNLTFNDPALAASHTVNLQGLSALTTYYFKARSRDLAGNVTTSDVQTFTTLATPAILFVDDDFGESYDRFFRSALQANGYTFDHWDVAAAGGVTPSSAVMANYKLVVWNTGYAYSGTGAGLSSGEQSAISNYLNGGGRIFLSGQDILFTGVTASFRQNYLKVASFTNDVRSSSYTASGVAGHPIGGGLNIPMVAPTDFPSIYADALTPTAGANGFLNHLVSGTTSPFSSVSFRGNLNAGGFGMVFMTTPFEAISTTATSPNNQVSFLKRVVDYLRPEVLVSAPSPSSTTTEAGGVSNFTVVLNSAPSANVVVPVSSSNPAEGVVNLSSLTFTPANWSTPQTVTVTGVDDSLDDNDQAYVIQLGAVTSADLAFNGFNPPDLNLVNLDNEFFPGIAVTAPTVTNEGNSGVIAVNFTVALSAAAPQTVSVDYSSTSNGYTNSATPGRDYISVSGRLDFAPGETSKTVSVNVRGDRLVELDEWFGLQLSNAQQGYLVDDLADVVISDEDTWAYPKEIDFGTELSPIKSTAAGVGDLPYDPVKGIGWYSGLANLQIVDRGLGTPVLRDIALTSNSGLALNVPNGNYLVIVTFGDSLQAHDQMRLTLEGLAKPMVNTAANQFLTRAYATAVTDGQLNLVFSDHGGIDPNAAIAGIAFQRR